MPGEDNGLTDALSREERPHMETVVNDGRQSGGGGCEGETSTSTQ